MVKDLPTNPGDAGDLSWIPGRPSGGRNGNPLQYFPFSEAMVAMMNEVGVDTEG